MKIGRLELTWVEHKGDGFIVEQRSSSHASFRVMTIRARTLSQAMTVISMLSDMPVTVRSNKDLKTLIVTLAVSAIFGTDFKKSKRMASEVLGEDIVSVAFEDLAREAING